MDTHIVIVIVAPRRRASLALAVESLRRAAAERGVHAAFETRGPGGSGERLDPADCRGALGALFVVDAEASADAVRLPGIHRIHRCDLDDVLAAPDAVLAAAVVALRGSAAPTAAPATGPAEVAARSASVASRPVHGGAAYARALADPVADPADPVQDGAPDTLPGPRVVGVTSCPTGIAHTFMAAEALKRAGAVLGHPMRVETRGSVGAQDALREDEIAAADVVIIAADTQVDLSRFVGKRLYRTGTKAAIRDGVGVIEAALADAQVHGDQTQGPVTQAAAGHRSAAGGDAAARPGEAGDASATVERARQAAGTPLARMSMRMPAARDFYRHLMTGVSHMLPFIVAGGLMIALSFAIGGGDVAASAPYGSLAWALHEIGARAAFALIVPALAGFVAFSIADRPGLAPGMIGGWIAASVGAGFLGGIAAGFVAGYAARAVARWVPLPKALAGLKPVLLIPLLATAIVGLTMVYVVGQPVAHALRALEAWLAGLHAGSALAFGALLGGMMSIDMGGPVNKTVYAFSSGLLASAVYTPMAATMAAGMTAPLGIALATLLFRDRFRADEREAGKAAGLLGLAFVSEGALPFAARDPLRTIPACVIGSAVTGAVCMRMGVQLRVPHGGVFVQLIPHAVTPLLPYALAIVAGSVLTALLLVLARGVGTLASDGDDAGVPAVGSAVAAAEAGAASR